MYQYNFILYARSKSRDEKYEDIIYWDSNAIASLYPQVEEFLDVGVEKTSDGKRYFSASNFLILQTI